MSAYALTINHRIPRERFSAERLIKAVTSGFWALLMPLVLLGGIYSGYFSPTEAATIALGHAILIECVIYRELDVVDLRDAAIEAATTLGTVFPILAIASSMNILLITQGGPADELVLLSHRVRGRHVLRPVSMC